MITSTHLLSAEAPAAQFENKHVVVKVNLIVSYNIAIFCSIVASLPELRIALGQEICARDLICHVLFIGDDLTRHLRF